MHRFLLLGLLGGSLVACDKGSAAPSTTCKDAVTKARSTYDLRLDEAETLVGKCELQAWSEAARTCVANTKAHRDLDACFEALPGASQRGSIREAMQKMGQFRDAMCGCKDMACAQKVSDDMTKWAQEQAQHQREPPRMSEEETKVATQIGEEMGKCMQKAMGGGEPIPEPVPARPARVNTERQ